MGENLTPWYQYRDPLVGILDYIIQVSPPEYDRSFQYHSAYQKKCNDDISGAGDIIAIAHDDDLRLIEGVVCPSQNARIYTRNKRVIRASREP